MKYRKRVDKNREIMHRINDFAYFRRWKLDFKRFPERWLSQDPGILKWAFSLCKVIKNRRLFWIREGGTWAGLARKYPPSRFQKKWNFEATLYVKVLISDFRGGRGEEFDVKLLPSEKTLLFAKMCLCVREMRIVEFPHPGPPPKHIPYAQIELAQP